MESERENEREREVSSVPGNVSDAPPVVIAIAGGRPPDDPPDKTSVNWSSQLFKNRDWHQAPLVSDDLLQSGKLKVSYPEGEDGTPWISIEQDVMETLAIPWRCSVVVKLLGRMISLTAFERRLRQLWNPSGEMVVLDLPNDYFLVRFENESDLQGALTRGPWMMYGHYMLVKQWDPSFNPNTSVISTTGVWVRISGLPLMMYEKNILFGINATIGNPLQVDENTMRVTRGRFARVCIEVDLLKPLKGVIFLNGERLNIEYEGLHTICYSCGTYGHFADHCPKKTQSQSTSKPGTSSEGEQRTEEAPGKTQPGSSNKNVGEWMTVPQRPRFQKGKDKRVEDPLLNSRNKKGKDKENISATPIFGGGNRFANLSNLAGSEEIEKGARKVNIDADVSKRSSIINNASNVKQKMKRATGRAKRMRTGESCSNSGIDTAQLDKPPIELTGRMNQAQQKSKAVMNQNRYSPVNLSSKGASDVSMTEPRTHVVEVGVRTPPGTMVFTAETREGDPPSGKEGSSEDITMVDDNTEVQKNGVSPEPHSA